jgi:hypothetical protein
MEGRRGIKKLVPLPGEEPLAWELCNSDMRFPKTSSNGCLMSQGLSDEAIVAIKPSADESTVTYSRINHWERDRDVKGEGWNMQASLKSSPITTPEEFLSTEPYGGPKRI